MVVDTSTDYLVGFILRDYYAFSTEKSLPAITARLDSLGNERLSESQREAADLMTIISKPLTPGKPFIQCQNRNYWYYLIDFLCSWAYCFV